MFEVGDLVALRSTPKILLPVMEVIAGGAECRYRVFQNNVKTTYYESQLQAAAVSQHDRKALTVRELPANLTSLIACKKRTLKANGPNSTPRPFCPSHCSIQTSYSVAAAVERRRIRVG